MGNDSAEAWRWLRYARGDLDSAEDSFATLEPRHLCFMAQQGTEKAIKAVLVYCQIEFPFTHDLEDLRLRVPEGWSFRDEAIDADALTQWAVESRYPTDSPEPTEQDACDALVLARSVLDSVVRDIEQRAAGLDTPQERGP